MPYMGSLPLEYHVGVPSHYEEEITKSIFRVKQIDYDPSIKFFSLLENSIEFIMRVDRVAQW